MTTTFNPNLDRSISWSDSPLDDLANDFSVIPDQASLVDSDFMPEAIAWEERSEEHTSETPVTL